MNSVITEESRVIEFGKIVLDLLEKDLQKPSLQHIFDYLHEKTGVFSKKISEEEKWELIERRFVLNSAKDSFPEGVLSRLVEEVTIFVVANMPAKFWEKVSGSPHNPEDVRLAGFMIKPVAGMVAQAELMNSPEYNIFLDEEAEDVERHISHLDQSLTLLSFAGTFLRKWGTDASFKKLVESGSGINFFESRCYSMASYASAIDFVNSEVRRKEVMEALFSMPRRGK